MGDLTSKPAIVLKGFLFLVLVVGSAGVLYLGKPSWRTAFLLVVLIWSSSRLYYFLFYVLERYVDSSLRYSGIWALLRAVLRHRSITRASQ